MTRSKKRPRIPIHWLHTQGYCEYQIQLEHVQKVISRLTPEMQLGAKRHLELEEDHKQKAELELTPEDALTKVKEERVTLDCRELPVQGSKIYGLIDEVHMSPSQVTIIDDKPNRRPYLSTKKQIWGYCLAFEEHFNPKLPIVACLRHRDTQDIIWKKEFTIKDKEIVQTAIDRITGIINQSREAIPTTNPKKCMKCRFQPACDVKNV
ncbi:MAG: Dna2/Cas4 domain-containing protein [Candidatus Hodarchaeota archaeon]